MAFRKITLLALGVFSFVSAGGACSSGDKNKGNGKKGVDDITIDDNNGNDGPQDFSDLLEDPELVSCKQSSECCEKDDTCTDPSSYICTTDNFCGKVEGSCETHGDCQGDTFCCEGESCRLDGSSDGVCISAAIPPGLACGVGQAVGEFAPDVQCEWLKPGPNDLAPDSFHVLATPLVVDLPYDSGAAAEIIIITAAATTVPDATAPGVLRILNGQDCTLHDSIQLTDGLDISALAAPAIGDVDGDGTVEIAVRAEKDGDAHHLAMLSWNGSTYVKKWSSPTKKTSTHPWAGPSLHDLNDDGKAEVLLETEVWDNQGKLLFTPDPGKFMPVFVGLVPVVADVDRDGKPELIASGNGALLWEWDDTDGWTRDGRGYVKAQHFAVADFGTPVNDPQRPDVKLDFTKLDGIAEIVAVDPDSGRVILVTTEGREVMNTQYFQRNVDGSPILSGGKKQDDKGGPPVIGDFDADGFPEIGVAGATRMRVIDPADCAEGCNGSTEENVRWSQPSQDSTSGQTGGTIFDFDGDEKAEMVYADECFLRVYAGDTGEVLFSAFRTSTTWLESPLVADIDNDENTELVVNSNDFNTACPADGSAKNGPYVDPIHPGIKCSSDDSCPEGTTCGKDNLCAGCQTDTDCCEGRDLKECGLTCTDRMAGYSSPASDMGMGGAGMGGASSQAPQGKVCRATHPGDSAELTGVRVLRDRLDRWASSRPIWNQHAYNVSNVMSDGLIPQTSNWAHNWVEDDLNNFRANVQGVAGFNDLPDITGRLADGNSCILKDGGTVLRATVCNRGKRAVGSELPATFYVGDPSDGNILCTSYSDGPVPTGKCKIVECKVKEEVSNKDIIVVVNDDGRGKPKTVECRDDNNTDTIHIKQCTTVL